MNMKLTILLVAVFMLAYLPESGQAAIFYVDAMSGNDSNDGRPALSNIWREKWLFKKVEEPPQRAACGDPTTNLPVHRCRSILPREKRT